MTLFTTNTWPSVWFVVETKVAVVLSVPLRYMDSDYPFGIFTLLLHKADEGCIRMRNASCAVNLLIKIRLKLSGYQKKDHCKMVQ